jgi:hypothetical protein
VPKDFRLGAEQHGTASASRQYLQPMRKHNDQLISVVDQEQYSVVDATETR